MLLSSVMDEIPQPQVGANPTEDANSVGVMRDVCARELAGARRALKTICLCGQAVADGMTLDALVQTDSEAGGEGARGCGRGYRCERLAGAGVVFVE